MKEKDTEEEVTFDNKKICKAVDIITSVLFAKHLDMKLNEVICVLSTTLNLMLALEGFSKEQIKNLFIGFAAAYDGPVPDHLREEFFNIYKARESLG